MVHELNTLAEAFGKGAEHHGKQEAHLHSNADLLNKPAKNNKEFYSEHYQLVDIIERITPFQPTRERVSLPFPKKEYRFSNTILLRGE